MVLGDEKYAFFLRQTQQLTANQWPLRQIKQRARFFLNCRIDRLVLVRIMQYPKIPLTQGKTDVFGRYGLLRPMAFVDKARPQYFVPRYDPIKSLPQCLDVQPSSQAECGAHVVCRSGRMVELIEEPEPLLGPRQR